MAAFSCYNNVVNGHPSLSMVSNQPISKFIVPSHSNTTSYHPHVINSLSDQGDDPYSSRLTSTTSNSSVEITHKMKAGTKKKRKISDSEVGKEGSKEKKQRRCHRGRMSKSSTRETIKDIESKGKKKIDEVVEYVHVRARRGQATDSHSLAERVRREQIGQRMRFLQSLVPGCDKIKGKVLVLDEIISYIQSLQNLVEFLAEKYASSYTMLNDLEILDFELSMLTAQGNFACFDEDPLFSANIQSDQSFQLAEEPPTFPEMMPNYAGTDWQYVQG